ncbi:MAG: CHASE2 domain-containing protein [Bdellovibrionaceae bacterium]|nr:CHASE2 domain-containing protein [Pseudobdellovibrionaceae bacterium]
MMNARVLTTFSVVFLFLLLWENGSFLTPASRFLEQMTLDFRYRNFSPFNVPSDKIIFIDIDQDSLGQMNKTHGAWPWKRTVWHDTVRALTEGQPKSILFDILLTENDQNHLQLDAQFADLIKKYPNVSLAMSFQSANTARPDRLPAATNSFSVEIQNAAIAKNNFSTFSRPYSPLWENLTHVHVVNSFKDTDGVFRTTPIFFGYDSQQFPSLGLKALQMYFEHPKFALDGNALQITSNNTTRYISLNNDLTFPFHLYGRKFQTMSFTFVHELANKYKTSARLKQYLQSLFKDKILIIGGSANELKDLKQTAMHSRYPGALLHATVISNIVEDHQLNKKPLDWCVLITLFLMALIYFHFIHVKNSLARSIIPLGILIAYIALGLYVFQVDNIALPLATPALFCLLSYFLELRIRSHSLK